MSDDIRGSVRDFITGKFPRIEFRDDEDIFALGFVNSLFAMELVMFVEKNLSQRIPNSELDLDNFRSVDRMVALTERLESGVEVSPA